MSVLPACIHVHHVCAWHPDLLQEQRVLLTTEPSLQSPPPSLLCSPLIYPEHPAPTPWLYLWDRL